MEIIPAIDLLDGRCVRLTRGEFGTETYYSNDPIAVAVDFERQGARRLHIVDLAGARDGIPVAHALIAQICSAVGIPVQAGGGIRTLESARMLLNGGVDRLVIGTAAVEGDASFYNEFGDKVALGLDVKFGEAATHGWASMAGDYLQAARQAEKAGCRRIVFTNVMRDGSMRGIDPEPVRALLAAVSIPVIASGGVASMADVKTLFDLGVESVIVGKAIYEGKISLSHVTGE